MKSRYVSLRKNPAESPKIKKNKLPGKGTRFGKHLFITYLKIEYTLCTLSKAFYTPPHASGGVLCFHVGRPCACPSVRSKYVRPSTLRFRSIT